MGLFEIMRVFRDLEIVEHLGSGVPRILEAYGRDVFEIRDSYIRIIFRKAESGAESEPNQDQDSTQDTTQVKHILEALRDGPLPPADLQKSTGLKKGAFRYCYNSVESTALVSHFRATFDLGFYQIITITEQPRMGSWHYQPVDSLRSGIRPIATRCLSPLRSV